MNRIHAYLAIRLIKNGTVRTLYDLHENYRLTHTEAKAIVGLLSDLGIVNSDGRNFYLVKNISKKQMKELYKMIGHRQLNLEADVISLYKKRAANPQSLYFPDLNRIGIELKVDD